MMRFLVCLDMSEFSCSILPVARKFAEATGATVELFMATPPARGGGEGFIRQRSEAADEAAREACRDALANAAATFDPPATITVVTATAAAEAIIEHERSTLPDLVLLATHSRGAFGEIALGSTARDVTHSGIAPVMLIHPVGVSGMQPGDIPLGIHVFTSDGTPLGEVAEVTDERLHIHRSGRDDLWLPVGAARTITSGHLALDAAEADIEGLALEATR